MISTHTKKDFGEKKNPNLPVFQEFKKKNHQIFTTGSSR